jgi:outer membrane receptor protein involved in Fe transport
VRFDGIAGTDGQPYTSADSFDTKELNVNALAAWSLAERWSVQLAVGNLLARRSYRPGSVLVPYFGEGRRLSLTLDYRY